MEWINICGKIEGVVEIFRALWRKKNSQKQIKVNSGNYK
jgi:hypothetical protein